MRRESEPLLATRKEGEPMKPGTLILALSLVALAALTLAGSASACTAACQRVGGGIFCRQCVDTGTYTGATCENSGPCGCFYTHNTCGLGLAGIQTETRTADLGFLATPTPRRRSAPRRRPMRSRTDDWLPVGDDLLSGGDDRRRRRDDRLWPK